VPVCLSLDIFPLYVTLKMGTCSWMEATSITYLVKCPIVLLLVKIVYYRDYIYKFDLLSYSHRAIYTITISNLIWFIIYLIG